MTTYIALLRGVNVGKANRVPMAEFRSLLSGLGFTGAATLLNSGNAVFRAAGRSPARHAADIAAALSERIGCTVPVVVMRAEELSAIVAECPIHLDAGEHSKLLVAFVQEAGSLRTLAPITGLVAPPERFAVGAHAAYLHCAKGILKSKAGAALVGRIGKEATTRNWATVLKLRALAAETD